jgi:hypothetical protein
VVTVHQRFLGRGKINEWKNQTGGADYRNLANPMTIDARYLWQTSDGEVIIVRNGVQKI